MVLGVVNQDVGPSREISEGVITGSIPMLYIRRYDQDGSFLLEAIAGYALGMEEARVGNGIPIDLEGSAIEVVKPLVRRGRPERS